MNTLIVSAGMPRSASTWLFNAARLALGKVEGIDLGAGWVDDFNQFGDHDVVLLKIHEYDQTIAEVASAVLYSYRDIRDAMASMKRAFGVEPDLELVENTLLTDVEWRRKASLVVKYEELMVSKLSAVQAVLRALGIEGMDAQELLRELDEVSFNEAVPGRGHDAETLLHAQHITDGRHGSWNDVLAPVFVAQIEKRYDWWLHENGYPS